MLLSMSSQRVSHDLTTEQEQIDIVFDEFCLTKYLLK